MVIRSPSRLLLVFAGPVIALACALLVIKWLRMGHAGYAAALGVALFGLVFYEPLPLVMGLLFALVVLLIFGGIAGVVGTNAQSPEAQVAVPILAAIGTFVFFNLLILSLPGIIAGIGLLQFRPWARILTIILSAFELMSVPFGTAIGIYGLWALLSSGGEELFREQKPQPVRV